MPSIMVSVPTRDEFKNRKLVEDICRWVQSYVPIPVAYYHDGIRCRTPFCECGEPTVQFEIRGMTRVAINAMWIRADSTLAEPYICIACQKCVGLYVHGAILESLKDSSVHGCPILHLTESPAYS